jgi:hypothetical protein
MTALPPEAKTIVEDTLIEHRAFAKAVKRLRQAFNYAHISPEPIGLALLGESRSGKSRAIEELEKDQLLPPFAALQASHGSDQTAVVGSHWVDLGRQWKGAIDMPGVAASCFQGPCRSLASLVKSVSFHART